MATLTIRQLDDTVYERLKARAKANNRSVEAEVRTLLEERTRSKTQIISDLRAFQDRMIVKHGGFLPDSTALIRQTRDEE
jgi:plasmid stability protein